jgi:hypothetical protein
MQEYMQFLAGTQPANKPAPRHDSMSSPSSTYPPILPTIADILPSLDGNAHNDDHRPKLPDPLEKGDYSFIRFRFASF